MNYQAINLNEQLSKFSDLWSPKVIGVTIKLRLLRWTGILNGTSIKVPISYLWCSKGRCSLIFVMVR